MRFSSLSDFMRPLANRFLMMNDELVPVSFWINLYFIELNKQTNWKGDVGERSLYRGKIERLILMSLVQKFKTF